MFFLEQMPINRGSPEANLSMSFEDNSTGKPAECYNNLIVNLMNNTTLLSFKNMFWQIRDRSLLLSRPFGNIIHDVATK